MVERDHHLSIEGFCHAQNIGTGHFIGDAAWILAIGTQRHVDMVLVAVFGIVVGVVRVAAVVQGTARGFKQIVYRALVHAVWQHTGCLLICRQRNQRRTVKRIQRVDFNIFDFHHIARLHHDAAILWHAPADPDIHAGLRADKGHVWRTVLHYGGGDIHINVIVMIVGCQYGIDLTDGERVEDKRRGAQVRLQLLHPRHTLHLMPFLH